MIEGPNQQEREPRSVRPNTSKHGHHPPSAPCIPFATERVVCSYQFINLFSMHESQREREGEHMPCFYRGAVGVRTQHKSRFVKDDRGRVR
jgi:hypothetical protein